MDINCQFSNPLYFNPLVGQLIPLDSDVLKTTNWNYTNFDCVATSSTSSDDVLPEYITHITSTSTPERDFYISNTIDLGQVLMLGFFILIFVFAIMISVKHLIFKKF